MNNKSITSEINLYDKRGVFPKPLEERDSRGIQDLFPEVAVDHRSIGKMLFVVSVAVDMRPQSRSNASNA